jgi:hypothetical protein
LAQTDHHSAAAASGIRGSPDAPESPQDPAAATEPDPDETSERALCPCGTGVGSCTVPALDGYSRTGRASDVCYLTTPDIWRETEFGADGYKLTIHITTDFPQANIEISSNAYATLWMKWDAQGFQQRAAVLRKCGRLAPEARPCGSRNWPACHRKYQARIKPPKRGYRIAAGVGRQSDPGRMMLQRRRRVH